MIAVLVRDLNLSGLEKNAAYETIKRNIVNRQKN